MAGGDFHEHRQAFGNGRNEVWQRLSALRTRLRGGDADGVCLLSEAGLARSRQLRCLHCNRVQLRRQGTSRRGIGEKLERTWRLGRDWRSFDEESDATIWRNEFVVMAAGLCMEEVAWPKQPTFRAEVTRNDEELFRAFVIVFRKPGSGGNFCEQHMVAHVTTERELLDAKAGQGTGLPA